MWKGVGISGKMSVFSASAKASKSIMLRNSRSFSTSAWRRQSQQNVLFGGSLRNECIVNNNKSKKYQYQLLHTISTDKDGRISKNDNEITDKILDTIDPDHSDFNKLP